MSPRRRPAPTVEEQRAAFEQRVRELLAKRDMLDLELEITRAVRDRLAGEPNTPDAVRRRYAARARARRSST